MSDKMGTQVECGDREIAGFPLSSDPESLNEAFGQCMPRLFRAADSVLRNHHDSEDALQDGLLSALRHIDQFKGNSKFSTWLFSIIRNAALTKLRSQHAHPALSIDNCGSKDNEEGIEFELPASDGSNPEREYAQAEISRHLASSLEDMPATYRTIVMLCDIEGFTGREAAQAMDLTVSAVKAQHHRARRAIRQSMGEYRMSKGD